MSSDEKITATAEWLDDYDRKAERRETLIMAGQAGIALLAAASLILWAFGVPLAGPAWTVIAALLAMANIYGQRSIRLLRRHARDLRKHADRAYALLQILRH